MRYVQGVGPLLLVAALGCGGADTTAPNKSSGVEIDGLHSQAPETWIQEKPSNEMRLAQFTLPGAGGADATVVVFRGISGTARTNIKRWEEQFSKIDGEPKKEPFKIADRDAAILDIQGTFDESKAMSQQGSTRQLPDYRMVAIHLDGKNGQFQIKMTGPAKTVERYKAGFDEWLKGFK